VEIAGAGSANGGGGVSAGNKLGLFDGAGDVFAVLGAGIGMSRLAGGAAEFAGDGGMAASSPFFWL